LWFWRFSILALSDTVLICRHRPWQSSHMITFVIPGPEQGELGANFSHLGMLVCIFSSHARD
jgi:hypothetical protein